MHHHTRFQQNRSTHCTYIATFRLFKMAAAAILDLNGAYLDASKASSIKAKANSATTKYFTFLLFFPFLIYLFKISLSNGPCVVTMQVTAVSPN